jgi:hypothetical protein
LSIGELVMQGHFALFLFLASCLADHSSRADPAHAAAERPISLYEVLRPLLGKPCALTPKGSMWVIGFRAEGPERDYKFDMLGTDFLCVANTANRHYVPFSAISVITTD